MKEGKGAVSSFTDAQGVTHLPGDIVELPESYKGEKWLESIEAEPKVEVPPAKVEAPKEAVPDNTPATVPVPLEEKKKTK